jgi:hypothetical protein
MTMENGKRVVEINGVKLEVDLRYARVISDLKVGDKVKVLRKEYGDSQKVYPGVLVGFEDFAKLPTIVVAILKVEYSGATLEFLYFNSESKDVEVIPSVDDYVKFEKNSVMERMDKEVDDLKRKIEDIEIKRKYFLDHFNTYFEKEASKA